MKLLVPIFASLAVAWTIFPHGHESASGAGRIGREEVQDSFPPGQPRGPRDLDGLIPRDTNDAASPSAPASQDADGDLKQMWGSLSAGQYYNYIAERARRSEGWCKFSLDLEKTLPTKPGIVCPYMRQTAMTAKEYHTFNQVRPGVGHTGPKTTARAEIRQRDLALMVSRLVREYDGRCRDTSPKGATCGRGAGGNPEPIEIDFMSPDKTISVSQCGSVTVHLQCGAMARCQDAASDAVGCDLERDSWGDIPLLNEGLPDTWNPGRKT
ncbi:hypothetical protein CDD83_10428 [Cordyceps sp. RAO-2017]|nr:hypothetical protein CDD83_10428 [Cordyceps sp. RAO-2017]